MNRRMDEIDDATISFAHRLADTAGAVILPYFRQRLAVLDKGKAGFDPVTAADREAEAAMRSLIRAERPDDGILGEEHGFEKGAGAFRWVLDPIDGTRAFITGRPTWGTLIALEKNEKRILGVIDQPFLRERIVGCHGRTQFHAPAGTMRLECRSCASLADAVVSTTHPWSYFTAAERRGFEAVCAQARMSSFGGDCYGYALLAMGHLDVIVEASLSPWDVAALVPIVEGAGGILTDWSGARSPEKGRIVAAGDARVHAQVLEILSRQ
jgi:myo-inositol-1(or 4)-monophosphatase